MSSKDDGKLIQTVVPPPLHAWVEKQSAKEGISVAAWVRRLIMQSREADRKAATS